MTTTADLDLADRIVSLEEGAIVSDDREPQRRKAS